MGNRWFDLPRVWIIISILMVVFSVGGNWYIYGHLTKDTVKRVEKLENCAEVHSEFDKRIDMNKQRSDNNYKDLQKDINNLDKKMDKVIDVLKEINSSAVIITKPLGEDSKKNNLE